MHLTVRSVIDASAKWHSVYTIGGVNIMEVYTVPDLRGFSVLQFINMNQRLTSDLFFPVPFTKEAYDYHNRQQSKC